jgi:CRP-like cAMP-binding protein
MPLGVDSNPERPVVRRLNALRRLSEAGAAAIKAALRERILKTDAGTDIACEGDRPETVRLILSGWACRYKSLEDGRRQIVNFVLPGDSCDTYMYLFSSMDHSIGALTPVIYSELERSAFEKLVSVDVTVAEAFYCEPLAVASIQREWAINLGRRDALERVAHLICELFVRLEMVGLVEGKSFALPVTQMDLADAAGLSTVHLNRTLQELRASGLITLKERHLNIHDMQALSQLAMFNPNYLHVDRK